MADDMAHERSNETVPNSNSNPLSPLAPRPSTSTSSVSMASTMSDPRAFHESTTRRPSQAQIWVPRAPVSSSESSPVFGSSSYHQIQHGSDLASPGLYSPATTAISSPGGRPQLYHPSPFLHYTHRQPVKETHLLDIEFDPISGRKSINHYEIINEIGRGVHGKVKLGRNLEDGEFVAIKIIERNSRPRLGRAGQKKSGQEETVRREIAILKKCRHENVVRLIEVIDDPASKKVYLVLEYVELGEICWRKLGDDTIVRKEATRIDRLRRLAAGEPLPIEDDQEEEEKRKRRRRRRRRERDRLREEDSNAEGTKSKPPVANENIWSLEFGGETEEDAQSEPSSNASDCSSDENDSEQATPQPAMEDDDGFFLPPRRNLSFSTTTTSTTDQLDPEYQYVPALTIQQARTVFRDTVLGLEYLHYQGIIHRDIKPANLLWSRDHRVKISDFGVSYLGRGADQDGATELDQSDIELAKTVGTPAFFAPELCYTDFSKPRPKITGAIDIWALGVTLYCLVFARCPFLADGEYELFNVIAEQPLFIPKTRLRIDIGTPNSGSRPGTGRRTSSQKNRIAEVASKIVMNDEVSSTHEQITPELRDLLSKLLDKDPAKRITLAEVKRHPWVLKGLEDPISWIEDSDPHRTRKLEVSKEDLDEAVVPVTVLGRLKNSLKKVVGNVADVVGLRRRAHSALVVPTASTILNITTDTPASDTEEGKDDAEYPHSEAEKALRKRRSSLAIGPPQPSPLRRATSVTSSGKERLSEVAANKNTLLLPSGAHAPPSTPTKCGSPSPPETFEITPRATKASGNSIFSPKFGVGKIVQHMKGRDLLSEPPSTTTAIEPGDADVVWTAEDVTPKDKEKKESKERTGSLRGWGGVLRRGSRQSCDSIMRLAAGFASDSRSSRSASPMPSMPTSPIDEYTRHPFPNFPFGNEMTNQIPSPSPSVQDDYFRRHGRTLSPHDPRRRNSVIPPVEEEHCPPSPDDDFYMAQLERQAKQREATALASGDDSGVSNRTTIKVSTPRPVWTKSSDQFSSLSAFIPPRISPRSGTPQEFLSPATFEQTKSIPDEKNTLCSSSSEDQFATSSLSNSTSYPSVLSASSSLSTDDHWSHYNPTTSPKARPSIIDPSDTCLNPQANSTRGNKKADASQPRTGSKSPAFFVGDDDSENEDGDENESFVVDPYDDGHAAEDEYEDDDEEDEEGFFLDLSNKQKPQRRHSVSVAEVARNNAKIAMERTDTLRP